MLDLLFVYGTLRSEFDNRYARLLRKGASLAGRTTVSGSIYRVRHFPAYRPQPAGVVQGELYRLSEPAVILKALDEYEGTEFERVIVDDASPNRCWIYQYKKQPAEGSRILSGDFCAP